MKIAHDGMSLDPDGRAAAEAATREALAGLSRGADFLLVYSTDKYDPQGIVDGVAAAAPGTPMAGCQVAGVLVRGQVVHQGVGVLAVAADHLRFDARLVRGANDDSFEAGIRAADASLEILEAGDHADALTILLPDAISGNAVDVMNGFAEEAGSSVRLAGGGAGDALAFGKTHQFCNGEVVSGGIVAIVIRSKSEIGVALEHGCSPWGQPMRVRSVAGKVLRQLDGGDAYSQYVEAVHALGEEAPSRESFAEFAMLHPFGIPHGEDGYVLRSALQVMEDGAILCCSDLPSEGVVRVMRADRGSLLTAATKAAESSGAASAPFALVHACVSRDLVLSGFADGPSAELAAVSEGLGPDTLAFGFLTYGQIGSLHGRGSQFHSKSVQVCRFAA